MPGRRDVAYTGRSFRKICANSVAVLTGAAVVKGREDGGLVASLFSMQGILQSI